MEYEVKTQLCWVLQHAGGPVSEGFCHSEAMSPLVMNYLLKSVLLTILCVSSPLSWKNEFKLVSIMADLKMVLI